MRSLMTLAATAAVLVVVPFAAADLTATVVFNDSYGSGNGGEFRATPNNFSFLPHKLTAGSFFETFCLERNEYISFNQTYYVDFSHQAVGGGVGGPHPDPLDVRTAYVYSRFVNQTLDDYDYGTGADRVRSANALQNVIWYLEQEITDVLSGLTAAEKTLATSFLATANSTNWTDIRNVRVMNVFTSGVGDGTGNGQDQLVMVPVPGAALLGMIGFGATRFIRRRFG